MIDLEFKYEMIMKRANILKFHTKSKRLLKLSKVTDLILIILG